MSRYVRRVALDLDWPLGEPWDWHSLDEPPPGTGWQLWEDVSEGSPVSPVFADAEGLARWLTTEDGANVMGPNGNPLSLEQARAFVRG